MVPLAPVGALLSAVAIPALSEAAQAASGFLRLLVADHSPPASLPASPSNSASEPWPDRLRAFDQAVRDKLLLAGIDPPYGFRLRTTPSGLLVEGTHPEREKAESLLASDADLVEQLRQLTSEYRRTAPTFGDVAVAFEEFGTRFQSQV